MTERELAFWRTRHPAYFADHIEALIHRLRLNQATPEMTLPEMAGYVADLDALRQLIPQAQDMLTEADNIGIWAPEILQRAVINAAALLRLATNVWGPL